MPTNTRTPTPPCGIHSYTSTAVPVEIVDGGTVTSTIYVPEEISIAYMEVVAITISHTRPADLNVYLNTPSGNRKTLFTNVCRADPDWTFENTDFTIVDNSANLIGSACPPGTAAYRGEGALERGTNARGTWTLEIRDVIDNGEVGALGGWELRIASMACPSPTSPPSYTPTDTPTQALTPTETPTAAPHTHTPTATISPIHTATATPSSAATLTNTPTAVLSPTHTPSASGTPGSSTPTATPSQTHTHTATASRTSTLTPSASATRTPTGGATHTATATLTATATETATVVLTATQVPATATATPTVCAVDFSDVGPTDYFYEPVRFMYCRGIISGYEDPPCGVRPCRNFRPYNSTTRAQMTKIVVLGFGLPLSQVATPRFNDVPTTNPFFVFIETAAEREIVSGYDCGAVGEPCPGVYFRPYNLVTRGQLSKIVVVAANWPPAEPLADSFVDVPGGSPFYPYVETAYCHGIISGYACGGPGEPCPGLYFRPGSNATRGQIAKIAYLAITDGGGCQAAVPAP